MIQDADVTGSTDSTCSIGDASVLLGSPAWDDAAETSPPDPDESPGVYSAALEAAVTSLGDGGSGLNVEPALSKAVLAGSEAGVDVSPAGVLAGGSAALEPGVSDDDPGVSDDALGVPVDEPGVSDGDSGMPEDDPGVPLLLDDAASLDELEAELLLSFALDEAEPLGVPEFTGVGVVQGTVDAFGDALAEGAGPTGIRPPLSAASCGSSEISHGSVGRDVEVDGDDEGDCDGSEIGV